MSCRCPECDWEGVGSDLGLQFQGRQTWASCPHCFYDLATITAFSEEEYEESYIGERCREFVALCKREQITDPKALPSIKGLRLEFTWDIEEPDDGSSDYLVVTCNDQEVLRELAELEQTHVSPHRKSFLETLRDYFVNNDDAAAHVEDR